MQVGSKKVAPAEDNHARRISIELPKAPARSSIKKMTGEKKASVQFKLDK